MESKGHNRPTRISNHGKSIKPKKESSKGNGHVEKTDRDKAKSSEEKQMLENGSNHMLDDGGEHEQQAEEKGSVSETNTDGNVNTETANNTNGGTDATERTNPVDTNGEQYEYVEHDNDEKWTTDEGNVNPLTSATPTDPEDFDSRSFLQGVGDLQARLRSVSSRSDTDGQFPADELMALVQDATTTLNNFKDYSVHSQTQMEELRHDMEEVGHRIVKQIQKRVHVTVDKTSKQCENFEECQLQAKLASLNAELARAGEDLARASRVSVETERAAVEASMAAEEATAVAETMQAEYERRREAEQKTATADEELRAAKEAQREAERRRANEAKVEAEEKKARLRRQENNLLASQWGKWPFFTYKVPPGKTDNDIGCVVRGDPDNFRENMLQCSVLEQLTTTFTLGDNEQLISNIIQISATDQDATLQEPIYVAIPYHAARPFTVREAVIKAQTTEGDWTILNSTEVTFDTLNYKDVKFAQAEVSHFTNLAVVTRCKRDFLHFTERTRKIVSSLDTRISFTVERNTFRETEHFTLQIQPVEASAINDLKNAEPTCSGLLASSAIARMEWASDTFRAPITVTLPCPANPVKAKKAAAMRAAKEAKMNNTEKMSMADIQKANIDPSQKKKTAARTTKVVIVTGDEDEREGRQRMKGPTKWYMGQYGNDDEDEDDILYFLQKSAHNRWSVLSELDIQQTKLDLLQFELVKPIECFMVLRTKPTETESEAETMAKAIEQQLGQKLVTMVLKQRSEDLCDVTLHVVHPTRAERLTRQLEADGFDFGPDDSAPFFLREGDELEVGFRGNVKSYDDAEQLDMVYNSQLSTSANLYAVEVDKFLQRSYGTYKGFVQLYRKVKVVRKREVKDDDGAVHHEEVTEYDRELLGELLVNVPKSPELTTPPPIKAPVTILSKDDGLGMDTLRHLSLELGDEWRKLAHQLNVRRVRVQAIMRNTTLAGRNIDDAKYVMLLTWMKAAPRGLNKVQMLKHALTKSGRLDLAQEVVDQWENFRFRKNISSPVHKH